MNILLQEVSPRDGLQNEQRVLSPEQRSQLIEKLADAGLPRIQIGSFVNPKLVPQMAGTDRLWTELKKKPAVRYSVLLLNEKGLDKAIASGIPHVEIYVSASETHNRRNSGVGVEKALADAARVIERARQTSIEITAGVMCAFGCFYEGAVPIEKVVKIVEAFEEKGPTEIGLADTTGMGDPEAIRAMIQAIDKKISLDRIGLHLHDTRGMGLANLRAAIELGVTRFDSSVAGLGGCPFIPGAVGNISTERAIEAIQSMGFESGINLEAVRAVGKDLEKLLR